MGMCDLVKILLELGAAPSKQNNGKYKPVDCAGDDATRTMFVTVEEGKVLANPVNPTKRMNLRNSPSSLENFTPSLTNLSIQTNNNSLSSPNPLQSPPILIGINPLYGLSLDPPSAISQPELFQDAGLLNSHAKSNSMDAKDGRMRSGSDGRARAGSGSKTRSHRSGTILSHFKELCLCYIFRKLR